MTLAARIDALAGRADPVLHDRHGAMSGQALHAALTRVGSSIAPGERVVVLAPPDRSYVATVLGVMRAGGVAVPLSPLHPALELQRLAESADPRVVLLDPTLDDRRAAFAAHRVDDPTQICGDQALPAVLGAHQPALMLFTSGTTGRPKGALLSHENLDVQLDVLGRAWGVTASDRLLHALPLHHMHGVAIALFNVLLNGGSVELLPRFDAAGVWDALSRSTIWMSVPTMLHRMLEALDAAEPAVRARWAEGARGLRLTTSGSAALPVRLAERWRAVAGEVPLERFGMTEIGVGSTNPLRGERRPGTVGHPLPTVETRIVDEAGRDAEEGELLIRGPSVFLGYFRREDATREAFVDGWFRTGDVARRDADGYLALLGRASVDILKSGGYKLSALEIEEALREHEGVSEVAVIGLPDEVWGDRVTACVVRRDEALDEAELRAFAKDRLAHYKVPRAFVFLPELPRNAMGKVMKPELRRRLEQA